MLAKVKVNNYVMCYDKIKVDPENEHYSFYNHK